jgi:hypothetical protein
MFSQVVVVVTVASFVFQAGSGGRFVFTVLNTLLMSLDRSIILLVQTMSVFMMICSLWIWNV